MNLQYVPVKNPRDKNEGQLIFAVTFWFKGLIELTMEQPVYLG